MNHKKNIFPDYINGLDVRPLGLSGRTVRLLGLRPQVLASAEQQAFLLSWLPAEKRSEALQQIEEDQGLWATPVWDKDQLELWLDTLACGFAACPAKQGGPCLRQHRLPSASVKEHDA